MRNIDLIRQVKQQATGRWQGILTSLGAEVPLNKHTACPACGGKDRFRFDDKEGNGTFICNQCGSGDGLDLVRRLFNVDVTEAAQEVAKVLAIPLTKKLVFANSGENPQPPNISAVEKATKLLEEATLGQSQYLISKGHTCSVNLLKDGSMILPVKQGDKLLGAQIIKTSGEKRFISGTKKKGGYIPVIDFVGMPDTVLIAEGYATALTVSQLHEGVALAALDEGNLLPVATWVRKHYPESKIIIAADNDVKPDEANIGKIKAEKTAKAVDGWVTIPPTKEKADWDDYRQQHGIEATKQAFIEGVYKLSENNMKTNKILVNGDKKLSIDTDTDIAQLAPNQLAKLLISRYGRLAVNMESSTIYNYNGIIWQPIKDSELSREMANFFTENNTHFSMRRINGVIDVLKVIAEPIRERDLDVIGFANGVLNTKNHKFSPHNPDDWLLHENGITYTEAVEGETLEANAPNYTKWLNHVSGGNADKTKRIKAGLYMVLANRYDWQLFIEVTGVGGSGKSVFMHIAEFLTGKHNTSSGELKSLDDARGRAQFIGKKLILLPDQRKYSGDGEGLKAITGGDDVGIDPKYEKQFSMVMKSVVIITGNRPMQFTERHNGIARRRVIFHFNESVPDKDKDKKLTEKIEAEIPVIIRDLLLEFTQPEKAYQLLLEQRDSGEATEVKRESDPLIDFCAYLIAMEGASGMLMGNANIFPPVPRKYLYHAYMAYMQGNGNKNALSLTNFGRSINGALKEMGKKYIRERTKHGYRTNLELDDEEAKDWLPSVPIA